MTKPVQLTQAALKKLAPRETLYTVWDAEVGGLCVRVTPAGGKSWNLDYTTQDGRRRRKKLGDVHVLPPAAARELARDALAQVARGLDPFAAAEKARLIGTVRELARDYIDDLRRRGCAATTIDNQNRWIGYAVSVYGALPLLSLKREDVRALHAKMTARGEITANRVLATLRAAIRWASDTGRVPEDFDPTRRVKRHKETARVAALSPAQWAALGAALEAESREHSDSRWAVECIRLIALTGRRNAEIRTLKWADVDLEAGTLRDIATKTGKKSFPLPPEALEILRRVRKFPVVSPYVFPAVMDPRAPLAKSSLHLVWERIRERAGLAGYRIHDLRHGVAGVGTSLGLPTSDVAHVLGHADARSSLRYAAAHDDHQRAVVNRVTAEIARQMRGES